MFVPSHWSLRPLVNTPITASSVRKPNPKSEKGQKKMIKAYKRSIWSWMSSSNRRDPADQSSDGCTQHRDFKPNQAQLPSRYLKKKKEKEKEPNIRSSYFHAACRPQPPPVTRTSSSRLPPKAAAVLQPPLRWVMIRLLRRPDASTDPSSTKATPPHPHPSLPAR